MVFLQFGVVSLSRRSLHKGKNRQMSYSIFQAITECPRPIFNTAFICDSKEMERNSHQLINGQGKCGTYALGLYGSQVLSTK